MCDNRDVTITAAADGSSLGNPGPAGWAWYVDDDCWAAGGWPESTNNRGELMAVLDLLRATEGTGEPLRVLCDSQYVINVVTKWTKGWKRKGWKKSDGKPVLNIDLVKDLDAAMQDRDVEFEWVRGHAGHVLNEAADARARAAATAFQKGREPDRGPGLTSPGPTPLASATHGAPAPAPEPEDDHPLDGDDDPRDDDLRDEADVDQPDLFGGPTPPVDDAPELDAPAIDQVAALERWLHSPAAGEDVHAWAALLHSGWYRVLPDGRLDRRDEVLSGVLAPDPCEVEVVEARLLHPEEILVLWRGFDTHARTAAATVHTSIWVRDGARWLQRCDHATPEH